MQQHDFDMQIPQARVLTDDELLQTQGGNIFSDVYNWLRGVVDPLPVRNPLSNAIHRVWEAVKQAV